MNTSHLFRKRPIPVTARQLNADSYREILDALTEEQFAAGGENTNGTVFLELRTLEGVMHASEGDWIVQDNHRHVWVVRGSIFAETYEPITAQSPADRAAEDEGDELVCVDMCGSCDACGMEPFGTPAEGWREASRFLRRTARDSGDRAGALHGARLIEAELRRVAEEAQAEERPRCPHCQMSHDLTPGGLPVAMCESVRHRIAKAEQLHTEGDHSLCARVDCDVVRDRAAAEVQP